VRSAGGSISRAVPAHHLGEGRAAVREPHRGVHDVRVLAEVPELGLGSVGVAEVEGGGHSVREQVGHHRGGERLGVDQVAPLALRHLAEHEDRQGGDDRDHAGGEFGAQGNEACVVRFPSSLRGTMAD
jgi:hypothetical protein